MAGKRRNSEKRKEKSRDAARCRRGKESEVFTELAQQLPISESMASQLDKASVMRLALSHLQISQIMMKRNNEEEMEDCKLDYLTLKALDGFVFMLSKDGDMIYVSESVIDMMGQSIYDFAHPCDHDEIKEVLSSKSSRRDSQIFFIRMKCTITSKGRSVIKCSGRMLDPYDLNGQDVKNSKDSRPFLAAVGEPIPHPSNIEVPLDSKTFLSRHNMDMKFTFCDERMKDLIGYDSEELLGKSLYNYHHVLDSEIVVKAYKDLFSKGQTMTGQYRFMAKHGGFVWVITQGTIIYNSRTQKPQCVVCVHFVVSSYKKTNVILSDVQETEEVVEIEELASPILSTEDVFQPRPCDVDEDFYFPPGTKKVEKQTKLVDLTHLAPNAGDGSPVEYLTTINAADISAMDKFFSALDPSADFDQNDSHTQQEDIELFGTTESVFIPKEQVMEAPPQPTRLKLREMLEGSNVKTCLERPPETSNIKQMKRPFDKSQFEKGPPAKERKIETGPASTEKQKPNSVLMNLLLRGEDKKAGYSVNNAVRDINTKQKKFFKLKIYIYNIEREEKCIKSVLYYNRGCFISYVTYLYSRSYLFENKTYGNIFTCTLYITYIYFLIFEKKNNFNYYYFIIIITKYYYYIECVFMILYI
ncbi:hypothetical protein KUTeg_013685 [Tegillarca granosa]|uniref:Hypoxia-inducible factor 1-alpha n=1 Tax=Tegillarca granosa TaxID=220873 RepID=A0ABQ9EUE0_TEGGR|nr:hypothetical protein KUTeg_013685 [Tegillarca granosa]